MAKRVGDFLRSDIGVLIAVAAIRFVFHLATNHQYGFHRDELQTLDDARHLDWGFVVYPPVTPLLGRLELALFGTSLTGFRVFSAMAVCAVMVLAGLTAKELGGRRHLQVLAAVAAGIAPVSMVQGAVFQYVAFDYLWQVTVTYLVIRLLKSGDARWWIGIGLFLGIGMQTRYTMGFMAVSLAVATILLPEGRRFLRLRWLWLGVGLSVLIFLPNLIWQVKHQFISLDFLSHLHARDLRQGRYAGFYTEQFWIPVSLVTVPLVLLGLWFYFVRPEGRRFRLAALTSVIAFVMFAIAKSRSYYTTPLYPVLIAGGCVYLGLLLERARPGRRRFVYVAQWAAIVLGTVLFAPLLVPIAPVGSELWKKALSVNGDFRDEFGWQELANAVEGVYKRLPPEERERTGILTGNYGEGGALNLYGPSLGLPRAMALTNSFWYRGYDRRHPQTVIVVGFEVDEARELFATCEVAAKNTNSYGIKNEESVEHPEILVCRNLRMSWDEYWKKSRRFG